MIRDLNWCSEVDNDEAVNGWTKPRKIKIERGATK